MKTITKTIDVYEFDELSQEAKDRARKDYNDDTCDYPFLTDDLREYIHEELKERGYTVEGISTSANPSIRPYYSLSYCQGDGLMFEATLTDKDGNTYEIKHAGHYYHEFSKDITATDKDGEEIDPKRFDEEVYIPICQKVAQRGYDEIAYQESEEYFAETCEANGYNFDITGKMINE